MTQSETDRERQTQRGRHRETDTESVRQRESETGRGSPNLLVVFLDRLIIPAAPGTQSEACSAGLCDSVSSEADPSRTPCTQSSLSPN